jgi:hypothetical protein
MRTCEALDKDGFTFAITVSSNERADIILTIAGHAERAVPAKRKPMKRARTMVAKVTPDKCRKMAAEAKRSALYGSMVPKRSIMRSWDYGVRQRADDRAVGHLVARAMARGESRVDLTPVFGFSMATSPQYAIAERKRKPFTMAYHAGTQPDANDVRDARLLALADYQYWRELEALSGERQQWKPGLTEETFYADQEIDTQAA